jgi:hypothetical protein
MALLSTGPVARVQTALGDCIGRLHWATEHWATEHWATEHWATERFCGR